MGLKKIKTNNKKGKRLPAFADKKASELTPAEQMKVCMQIAEKLGHIKENDL